MEVRGGQLTQQVHAPRSLDRRALLLKVGSGLRLLLPIRAAEFKGRLEALTQELNRGPDDLASGRELTVLLTPAP